MSLTETANTSAPAETHEAAHDEVISAAGLKAIYAVLLAVVAAWGSAIYAYGIPGLYMPAVAAVPVIWIILLVISRG
ncbi:hypothetical protein [Shimia aestuarii]|uniref:Uncharacterized protein n=1 Tax=Shimia aestuarii TaxID=254406 RepID=A0A1I4J191_9RHOB|nr:hypothetical protein [Shimia aestuarii]SFL60412.1 hypothetical protein SAMN04488042_101830 [Shimia aestuarii]